MAPVELGSSREKVPTYPLGPASVRILVHIVGPPAGHMSECSYVAGALGHREYIRLVVKIHNAGQFSVTMMLL